MKKNTLLITLFFSCLQCMVFYAEAQTLYGLTSQGGNDDVGTITKFLPAVDKLEVTKTFESAVTSLASSLIQASDGKLYAMKTKGGKSGYGVIFNFDPATATYKRLFDFDGTNGAYPYGSLMQASDGKLYGMTYTGGKDYNGDVYAGRGVIFSFDPSNSIYTKLFDFDYDHGGYPLGSLIQATDGKLYGLTSRTIISFDPATAECDVLKVFQEYDGDGSEPHGSLMQAKNGRLYGTTWWGGENDGGVIFSFDLSTSTYNKLKDFTIGSADGSNPRGSLIQARDGMLYGLTYYGGTKGEGVIYSVDPVSSEFKKVADLIDSITGRIAEGDLVEASDGKFYAMTMTRVDGEGGVLFSYDRTSSTFTKLKDFDDFGHPYGSLVEASDGKLYGMTSGNPEAPAEVQSIIFSFDPASSAYTVLKDFHNINGASPAGRMVPATNGKLYGITSRGGSKDRGVIFSFNPSSYAFTKLKDFKYVQPDGANPYGALIQLNDGKLYGTTRRGGDNGTGIIFSFDPLSNKYSNLVSFEITSGANPSGGLVQADNGKLYGTTSNGGSLADYGVLYSFDPASLVYSKLKDFNAANGHPRGSLVYGSDGKLYGMASQDAGNATCILYSFDPVSSDFIILKDFRSSDGNNPAGNLVQASNGKLYGLMPDGGANGYGVIFSYDPFSAVYSKLLDFDSTNNGSHPDGSLMEASDGKLYGATGSGGAFGYGVVFSIDPVTSLFSKLKDYDNANGAYPGPGFAFVEVKSPPIVTLTTPVNNTVYLAGANVYLTAVASDADGKISKVEFYNGSKLLYSTSDTPYYFKWPHVRLGSYTLTAKATDNTGIVTTSDTVHISVVPNKPPTVTIMSPVDGKTFFTGTTVQLQAAASDTDGRIYWFKFYVDTSLLVTLNGVPFTYEYTFADTGTFVITAKVMDNWGAITTSVPIRIRVVPGLPPSPPAIALTMPLNNATYLGGANVYLNATASDADGKISKVQFYNGSNLLYSTNDTPYYFKWPHVRLGRYILTAKATDNTGLVSTSDSVLISVVPNKPPAVNITNPVDGEMFVAGTTLNLQAVATDIDGRIFWFEFYSGTTLLTRLNQAPYTYDYTLKDTGTYIITAKVMDNWGAITSSKPIRVTVPANDGLLVSRKKTSTGRSAGTGHLLSIVLAPNPVKKILNVYTTGFQEKKRSAISILSTSGVILQTKVLNNIAATIQLDVSFLARGVYILKINSDDKVMYRQFVKM